LLRHQRPGARFTARDFRPPRPRSTGEGTASGGDGSDLLVPRARDPTHQSTRMALAEGWGRPGSGREGAARAWVKWAEREIRPKRRFGVFFSFFYCFYFLVFKI
jgi:hypothetical protein